MNRRDFLRNCAIIAGGVIAADQLELLERLAPRRLFWPGADFKSKYIATLSDWDRLLRESYVNYDIPLLFDVDTPLAKRIIRPLATDRGYHNLTYEVRLRA